MEIVISSLLLLFFEMLRLTGGIGLEVGCEARGNILRIDIVGPEPTIKARTTK